MSRSLRILVGASIFCVFAVCLWWAFEDKATDEPVVLNVDQKENLRPPNESADSWTGLDTVVEAKGGEDQTYALEVLSAVIGEQRVIDSSDQQMLLAFATSATPQDLTDGEWQHRFNEIMNALRVQPEVQDFADELVRVIGEADDEVIRLYALQHLAAWYPFEAGQSERKKILQCLKDQVNDVYIGTTALMMLDELERGGVATGAADDLDNRALAILHDDKAPVSAKVSAFHLCADRGLSGALGEARVSALDEMKPAIQRKAAIHCIGRFGSRSDMSILDELARNSPELKIAVSPAQQTILERFPE